MRKFQPAFLKMDRVLYCSEPLGNPIFNVFGISILPFHKTKTLGKSEGCASIFCDQ